MCPLPTIPQAVAPAVLILAITLGGKGASAYTPNSPEVQAMLDNAAAYLLEVKDPQRRQGHSASFGATCFIAYAFYHHTRDPDHPIVAQAVEAIMEECEKDVERIGTAGTHGIYHVSVAVMLLCELDPDRYQTEIQRIVDALLHHQKSHGGWGYLQQQTGDTSQVQFVMMALWAAKRNGFDVPDDPVARLCNWLLRTQDPGGGWGYQGEDPGSFELRPQQEIRHGVVTSGVATLMITANFLGLSDAAGGHQVAGQPPALRRVVETPQARSSNVELNRIRQALQGAQGWLVRNDRLDVPPWTYYYLYALERYYAFLYQFEGREVAEPEWYARGVRYLMENQNEDGSWGRNLGGIASAGVPADTAMAMLFLMRGTQRLIREMSEGMLVGGYGLPKDTSELRTTPDGRVVAPELAGSFDEMLELLAHDDSVLPSLGAVNLQLSDDPQQRSSQMARLRRLVVGGDYQARRAAVRLLAQTRDYDNIPYLIFALSDPDDSVMREAQDGLRFMTRKFTRFELTGDSTPQQRREVERAWKDWYRSIRPDVVFLD